MQRRVLLTKLRNLISSDGFIVHLDLSISYAVYIEPVPSLLIDPRSPATLRGGILLGADLVNEP